ncbi:hypothetical protein SUDANB126_07075 [Streptomyces sp. enrichment culture]
MGVPEQNGKSATGSVGSFSLGMHSRQDPGPVMSAGGQVVPHTAPNCGAVAEGLSAAAVGAWLVGGAGPLGANSVRVRRRQGMGATAAKNPQP